MSSRVGEFVVGEHVIELSRVWEEGFWEAIFEKLSKDGIGEVSLRERERW